MATNTVDVSPNAVSKSGQPKSATPIERVYIDPADVFNELPKVTLEELDFLVNANSDFSKIIAAGHVTDNNRAEFRTQLIRDMVHNAAIQKNKQIAQSTMLKARKLYQELVARGVPQAEALKVSKYDPFN